MISLAEIQHKIDFKTKPLGALGDLESLALQICRVQNTLSPQLIEPLIVVFAADHGIANEGVSAYPQDVTWQMVLNFLNGGAAINVFANQHQIKVKIVDTGVNKDFGDIEQLISCKVNYGSRNFLNQKALTIKELELCFENGRGVVKNHLASNNTNIIGFGEMGIGNTSSAAMLMHCLTDVPLKNCIGRGTGLNDAQYLQKQSILTQALNFHKNIDKNNILEVLQTFGGFEIATMVAALQESYDNNLLILVDGFISTVSLLVAYKLNPKVIDNVIFCHQSHEGGHALLLQYLNGKPILNLNMRLGEGSACALAYPLVKSACDFMNNMASFESASVSNKEKL